MSRSTQYVKYKKLKADGKNCLYLQGKCLVFPDNWEAEFIKYLSRLSKTEAIKAANERLKKEGKKEIPEGRKPSRQTKKATADAS